jgi:hypothetical protein
MFAARTGGGYRWVGQHLSPDLMTAEDHSAARQFAISADLEAKVIRHSQQMVQWYRGLLSSIALDPFLPGQSELASVQVVPIGVTLVKTGPLDFATAVLLRVRNNDGSPLSFHQSFGFVYQPGEQVIQRVVCPLERRPSEEGAASVQSIYSEAAYKAEMREVAERGLSGLYNYHSRPYAYQLLVDGVTAILQDKLQEVPFGPEEVSISRISRLPKGEGAFLVETDFGNVEIGLRLHAQLKVLQSERL